MITFDHAYTYLQTADQYKALGDLGFLIDFDYLIKHPGSLVCRFILFESGRYLEFVMVEDWSEYFRREGNVLNEEGKPVPGMSGRTNSGLKKLVPQFRELFPANRIDYIHRNYKWAEDISEAGLGWNFLTLGRPIVKNFYLWHTEYERDPSYTPRPSGNHPNSLNKIVGFAMIFNDINEKNNFYSFFQLTETRNGVMETEDKEITYFYEIKTLKSNQSTFHSVIFKIENQEAFRKFVTKPDLIQFGVNKFHKVKSMGESSWEIWAV